MADNEQFLVTPQTSAQITQETTSGGVSDSVKDLERKRARHYLFPGISAFVMYLAAAFVLLIVLNWGNIFTSINKTTGSDPLSLTQSIKVYADNPTVSWATIVLFWGSVGLAVYTLYWLGSAFFTAARNEMIVETAFSRRGHFWDKIRVPLIKVVLLAAVAIVIVLSLKFSVPALGSLAASGIFLFSSSIGSALGYLAGALFGTVLNIYVIATLITFYRHAEGIF
jgi:hypothetical protein